MHRPNSPLFQCLRRSARAMGRAEDGMMFVEFALIASMLLVLLMGAFDFGRLGMRYAEVQSVAKSGVQYVLQNQGNISDTAGITAAALADAHSGTISVQVNSYCQCAGGAQQDCSTICADGKYPPRYVSVTATDTMSLVFPYPGVEQDRTVIAASKGRVR